MTEFPCVDVDDLNDQVVQAWLSGGPAPAGFAAVGELLAELSAAARQQPPVPSAALAQILDGGGAAEQAVTPAAATGALFSPVVDLVEERGRRRQRAGTTTVIAVAVALSSVGVAAATGRLPDRAQDVVSHAVEAVTPFALTARAGRREPSPAARGAALTGVGGREVGSSVPHRFRSGPIVMFARPEGRSIDAGAENAEGVDRADTPMRSRSGQVFAPSQEADGDSSGGASTTERHARPEAPANANAPEGSYAAPESGPSLFGSVRRGHALTTPNAQLARSG